MFTWRKCFDCGVHYDRLLHRLFLTEIQFQFSPVWAIAYDSMLIKVSLFLSFTRQWSYRTARLIFYINIQVFWFLGTVSSILLCSLYTASPNWIAVENYSAIFTVILFDVIYVTSANRWKCWIRFHPTRCRSNPPSKILLQLFKLTSLFDTELNMSYSESFLSSHARFVEKGQRKRTQLVCHMDF